MCNPVSWFYVRHGVSSRLLISEKSDSHTKIAEEFGVRDTIGDVAAGEFSPDPANPSPDLATWRLVWDYMGQSRRPEWMDDEAESHLRAELERRCAAYVFTSGTHDVSSCRAFAFGEAAITVRGDCRALALGSSLVMAYGSSHVMAYDSSRVTARGSSQVMAYDSSRVTAYDSSRVTALGSSQVMAYDSSRVTAYDSSQVTAQSSYADILGRMPWDGKGYKPVRCIIEVGQTYAIVGDNLAAVGKGGAA